MRYKGIHLWTWDHHTRITVEISTAVVEKSLSKEILGELTYITCQLGAILEPRKVQDKIECIVSGTPGDIQKIKRALKKIGIG